MSDDDAMARAGAIPNAQSIALARQKADEALLQAKRDLELKTCQLEQSLATIRATLESTSDGILAADDKFRITAFNRRFLILMRLSEEQVSSGNHLDMALRASTQFSDPKGFLQRLAEIYSSSMPESYDVLACSDGRVLERYSQIQYVRGEANGRVWSYRDITEQRRAAAERELLLESERAARAAAEHMSSMKDDFLATLSHELRTPLGAILGWAQILRRGAKTEQDLQRGLETIERNARAQAQLIDDLLDMSRINSGKLRLELQALKPAAVIEAAVDAVRPLAASKDVAIEVLLDPIEGQIPGDPGRLQQVAWNLLVNAIKFTQRGGAVKVRLACVDGKAEISVTDNGVGIAPEFLEQMFDRFRQADGSSTRSFGGLGLGLSIVRSLTELHGGTVRASSGGLGSGATFTVILPLLPCDGGAAAGRQRMRAFVPVDLAGLRVLVVDDEPDARDMLRRLLEDCEATVFSAGSAAEAQELLRRELPDVLVSDIGMPGVDGYALLKRVRLLAAEQGGGTPAIALTAFARPQDRAQALKAGYQAHVAKPVEPSELVATVASVAGRAN